MIAILMSSLLTSSLAILGKLVTEKFMESLLTKVIIYAGERLAPMTSNKLDDEIVTSIKEALNAPSDK